MRVFKISHFVAKCADARKNAKRARYARNAKNANNRKLVIKGGALPLLFRVFLLFVRRFRTHLRTDGGERAKSAFYYATTVNMSSSLCAHVSGRRMRRALSAPGSKETRVTLRSDNELQPGLTGNY